MNLRESLKRDSFIWGTGLASAAFLAFMNLSSAPRFASMTMGRKIPDSDLSSTVDGILQLRTVLETHPNAAVVLRDMHLYADMALPILLASFFVALIVRLSRGATIYRRSAESVMSVTLAFPILYALCDYSENVLSLMLFPPSHPNAALAWQLAEAMHWATKLKFMFAALSCVMILRLALSHLPFGSPDRKS